MVVDHVSITIGTNPYSSRLIIPFIAQSIASTAVATTDTITAAIYGLYSAAPFLYPLTHKPVVAIIVPYFIAANNPPHLNIVTTIMGHATKGKNFTMHSAL